MTRPYHGNEAKKSIAVRVEPAVIKKIMEKHGSFTVWINQKLEEDGFATKHKKKTLEDT